MFWYAVEIFCVELFVGAAAGLGARGLAKSSSLSSSSGLVGLSGLGAVPLLSASPVPFFSIGLMFSRGDVSLYVLVPPALACVGGVYVLPPEDPDGFRPPSSGYGTRPLGLGGWLNRSSKSSGYGSGAAELEAPGGSGNVDFEEAPVEDEDEVGGAGYWKRLPVGLGLAGLNILRGSTVGLSPSLEGPGLLMKSSSSGTSRDRVAILTDARYTANYPTQVE